MKVLPLWAEKILRIICPEELYEQIEGDLIEIYHYEVKTLGRKKAKMRFILACVQFIRPGILLRNKLSFSINTGTVLHHYLKILFRTNFKNRTHSLINIGGLVIGMTACMLISLYVFHEKSYDNFHEKKDHVFRVRQDRYTGKELTRQWTAGAWGIGPDLKHNFPEVKRYVSINRGGNRSVILSNENIFFEEQKVLYASKDFFTIFSFPLLQGVDSLVLQRPFTMVVSESLAKRYFGSADVVGKTLKCNGNETYEITGVVKDVPQNTHLKFDALLSYESLLSIIGPADVENLMSNWGWSGNYTYLELHQNVNPKTFEAKIPAFVERKMGNVLRSWGESMRFVLQPVAAIHLDSDFKDELEPNGDRKAVNFLSVIAAFILAMAWINYVNLTTARSIERAREVGIRKVLGTKRYQLIGQFIFESFTTMLLAVFVTALLVYFLLPVFTSFIQRKVDMQLFTSSDVWPSMVGIFCIGVLISGVYPAFVMSGFRPIDMLKGNFRVSVSGNYLRKALVSIQFISSVVLIAGIFAVYKQIAFMRSSELGMNSEQVLVVQGPSVKDSTYQGKFNTFRESLLEHPEIKNIAVSTDVPGRSVRASSGSVRIVGQDVSMGNSYRVIQTSENYFETLEMKLVAGRTFATGNNDHWRTALVNETAMRLLGITDPAKIIGQKIDVYGEPLEVIGVIKDYHQESLKKKVDQLIFVCDTEASDYYSIKFNTTGALSDGIAKVQAKYRSTFPGNPFNYFFLDDYFNQQYAADVLFGKVCVLFTLLTVVIASLGLFGLSSYMVIRRTKEIGIRKVLGASVWQITSLVSKEFSYIILIANIISWPISFIVISNWLDGFAYKINLGMMNVLIPTAISLLMAMVTVMSQSIRAAQGDPVNNLKAE